MRRPLEENEVPRDESGLARLEDHDLWMRFRKGTLVGNVIASLYRQRRVPARALAAARTERADRNLSPLPSEARRSFSTVYVIPAGPGDWAPLRDTIESVLHFEGDDAKVVVVDDASSDCRSSIVKGEFPGVDVLHRSWPTGGPPRDLATVTDGIRFALSRYEFDVLIKLDTDALVTGSSPGAAAAELFAREPGVGMAGTYRLRADGAAETYAWDRWILRHSVRWSRTIRNLLRRAKDGGYDGTKVRGGVYALSRSAVASMHSSGDLDRRMPMWTQLAEDFWISLMVLANGFRLGSLGAPEEPFVVASNYLPIPKERILADGKLAIHSVRRGLEGEGENELRGFFREARESDVMSRHGAA